MKRFILLALALGAVAALAAVPAQAGKGGHVPKSEGTLVVTPSSITVGATVTISGSAFKADTQYFLHVYNAAGDQVFNIGTATDASGSFDGSLYTPQEAGEQTVQAFELKPSGVLATKSSATATLTVA